MKNRQMNILHDLGSLDRFCIVSRKSSATSRQQNPTLDNLSDADVSIQFESPSFVLCATDQARIGLTDCGRNIGNGLPCSQMLTTDHTSAITALRSLNDFDSAQKDYANFQHRDTLHSLVQSSFQGNQVLNLQERTIRSLFHQQKSSHFSFDKKFKVKSHSYDFQIMKPTEGSIVSNSAVSQKPTLRNTNRIRWTQDLHKKFMECVNQLGGAKKATPKGILKLMKCDGLTIFHVKSHLQKYRVSHYISESTEDTGEKPISTDSVPQLDAETGMQIVETLRLQIDVQRRLYEQLESARNLQMRIEEQAKQLQTMLECQVKTT